MQYVILILGIFLGELGLKNRVEHQKKLGEERACFGGRILLRRYHNYGAFHDMGENHSGLVKAASLFLTVVACVVFVITFGTHGKKLLKTGMAFLLGGAFSNTYDRLRRGFVVDYLSFGVRWKPLRRMVFNLADFFILVGSVMAAFSW